MAKVISRIFDGHVELDDAENFREVHFRITQALDGFKDKRSAAEFIFGCGTADAMDNIMEQFHSLNRQQAGHFEWMIDNTLWSICTDMQNRYNELSGGYSRRNGIDSKAMNSLIRDFRKSIDQASTDLAVGLLGIEYPKIRREDLKPGL